MPSMTPETRRIRFADFEANLNSQELLRAGAPVRLPNQSFTALAMLLERPGELVSRDELRARLWPGNRVVEFEQGLNAIINRLREALGDSAENPIFIETLPRRGYRFVGQLVDAGVPAPSEAAPPPPPPPRPSPSPTPRSPRTLLLGIGSAVLMAAVIGAAAWHGGRSKVRAEQGTAVVPLTTLLGQERMPALSPDGQRVAFAWNGESDSGRFDLYTRRLDTERLTRLTNSAAVAISGAWSPDGTRLAFTRMSDVDGGVFVVASTGGDARKLADASFTQESLIQPAWSPDGATLAYPAMNSNGSQVVHLLTIDTSNDRPLEQAPPCRDAGAPSWSGDGKQLAFVCMTSVAVYEVYIAKPGSGAAPRRVATLQGFPQGLAWLPDADRILIANESGNGSGLWQLELDGSLSAPRVPEEAIGSGVTARGGRVIFARARQNINIWHVSLAAGSPEPPRKWISSTRAQITPQYSPDDARIAFQSNRSGSPEIWIADADGSNAARLTNFGGPLTGAPAWCSDGRRLAFDARESGASAVYVVDTFERVPQRVVTSQANLALPAWLDDCRWLLASDGRQSLYRVPSAGGEARPFTTRHSYQAAVAGDRVVFNVTESEGVTLWTKPLAGGSDEAPLPGLPRLAYSDSWAVTERGVFFTDVSAQPVAVKFYDFGGASVRAVAMLPNTPTPLGGLGLAVSHDGKSLLYTHTEDTQSDLMLEEGAR